VHEAVRSHAPGLVELWPLITPEERAKIEEWDAPFDVTSETSPRVKLARLIANTVKVWRARGDLVGDGDDRHPVRAGDILILVRQRGPLFEAIIRQLKNHDIPVAGADRLILTEHIAILDLLALADALLLPEDELALAAVLKSPLFGLSESDLFDLAFERKATLRATLRTQRPDVGKRLDDLAEAARLLTPFAFYSQLLGAGRARKAFLGRLGAEANDALDEFLNLALAYESRETPSLQGFVAWLRTASAEIKRDLEIARDEVRVMTVHGAKGLEAPIVILADTTTEPAGPTPLHDKLHDMPVPNAAPDMPACIAWMPSRQDETGPLAKAREDMIAANKDEHRRLLYVAMTRAADRLVVCGALGLKKMPDGAWYQLVEDGLAATGELVDEPADHGDGIVRRFRRHADVAAPDAATPPAEVRDHTLPDWLKHDVAPEAERTATLTPSDFEGETHGGFALRGTDRKRALMRGSMVHRLMQSLPDLPPERRAEAARRYLVREDQGQLFTEQERQEIANLVLKTLVDLRFADLFVSGSRAEVSIVGRVGDRSVSGQVDRLVVTREAVLIADYKTNRPAPKDLDEARKRHPGYIRQLALYRAMLARLYPDRPIRAALLWTDTADLMEVPAAAMDEALAALT
jgi:ATP-dependent helicase/nuclease subunit A